MLYQVSRDGSIYGPYTLEDLTRYVASGNVQLSDMAKGEGMTEWIPVSQVLGTAPAAAQVPFGFPAAPAAMGYPAGAAYDSPPNLNWGLVLLFSFFTCGLFMFVWNLILAAWTHRIAPASKVLPLYIGAAVLLVLQVFAGARNSGGHAGGFTRGDLAQHYGGTYLAILILCWVVRLVARFTMRNTLEAHYNTVEPIGLRMSGVLTFFFGGPYIQYTLNRVNDMKRAMGYRGAAY